MSLLHQMLRRLLIALVAACSLAAACSGPSGPEPRYPRRRPGCDLVVYNGLPTGAWNDIGMAEVGCYLDESEISCLGRLRTEACRMGGDIIYNVPKRALRPVERGMVYRAMVAHTATRRRPMTVRPPRRTPAADRSSRCPAPPPSPRRRRLRATPGRTRRSAVMATIIRDVTAGWWSCSRSPPACAPNNRIRPRRARPKSSRPGGKEGCAFTWTTSDSSVGFAPRTPS
jgi:hypothetical protein